MVDMGKLLIGLGVMMIIVGGVFVLSGSMGDRGPFIGRLPGDIHVQREKWSFYFPLTTSILISVILTLILSFFSRR